MRAVCGCRVVIQRTLERHSLSSHFTEGRVGSVGHVRTLRTENDNEPSRTRMEQVRQKDEDAQPTAAKVEVDLGVLAERLRSLLARRKEEDGPDHRVLSARVSSVLLEDAAEEEARHRSSPTSPADEALEQVSPAVRLSREHVESEHAPVSPENLVLYYMTLRPPTSSPSEEDETAKQKTKAGEASKSAQVKEKKKDEKGAPAGPGYYFDNRELDSRQHGDRITPMPLKPYYFDLAKVLRTWAQKGDFPFTFEVMEGQELLAMVDNLGPVRALTPFVLATFSKFNATQSDVASQEELLGTLLEKLELRGMLTCLRLRQTFKSVDDFPPSCERLIQALNAPHASSSPSTRITVGGRALSKHGHRAADGWWGSCTGAEEVKNKNAERVTRKIFANATWINLHLLPHDIITYEVRTKEGYGARWVVNRAPEFRGFIEPQMEDGHDKRWRH